MTAQFCLSCGGRGIVEIHLDTVDQNGTVLEHKLMSRGECGRCNGSGVDPDPMPEGPRCTHGAILNQPWPKGLCWMEAYGTCGCCGSVYFCWYGHVPADRCKQCGGREMTAEEQEKACEPPKPPTLLERLAVYKAKKREPL